MKKTTLYIITLIFSFGFVYSSTVNAQTKSPNGLKIFKDNKCTKCHTISSLCIGAKVKKVVKKEDDGWGFDDDEDDVKAPDLSDVGLKFKAEWMSKWLRKKVKLEGKKHKRPFKGSKDELQELVTWLATLRDETNKVPELKKTK